MVINSQLELVAGFTGRRRDARQAHYTSSPHIRNYMASQLKVSNTHKILEPCAGEGHLIEAVLAIAPASHIDAFEYDSSAAKLLEKKYSSTSNVHICNQDTLAFATKTLVNQSTQYDRIIANPPYGAWQDYSRRHWLQKRFPDLYVRETYGLFLYCCINLLVPGGRLVFIIPDTYLNLHLHRQLRYHILTQTWVEEIVIFPSRFFRGVSYGYAKMSIITLTKKRAVDEDEHEIRIVRNLKSAEDLSLLAQGAQDQERWDTLRLRQRSVLQNPSHALLLPDTSGTLSHITSASVTIGEIADVVTGFYSGDDRKWLRVADETVRGARNYKVVDREHITPNSFILEGGNLLGLSGRRRFIPIVKGGGTSFIKPTQWYVDWSVDAIKEYTKPKPNKARFQNSQYYFREGIAVPMVSSTRVTAALLEKRLFDQSIVGVFPHDGELLLYLLGFFNSDVCTRLLRTINPTANNSANYIKKIPFVRPTYEVLNEVVHLVEEVIKEIRTTGAFSVEKLKRMNELFELVYQTNVGLTCYENRTEQKRGF